MRGIVALPQLNPKQPGARPLKRAAKNVLRRWLARFGYSVRGLDHRNGVTGVDLLYDVSIVLGRKRGATLFDVGANTGQTIDAFVNNFREPRIFSFEPSPATFATLQEIYGGKANICLEPTAVGDKEETLPFHVTPDYSVNDSLLNPAWSARAAQVPVRVITLDNYCSKHGIHSIDFLKIDTQGYDLHVLRGANEMVRNRRIAAFCVELTFVSMYEHQPRYIDMLTFIDGLGYRLLGIYDHTYLNNTLSYANACYVYKQA
jgi:FkbM family methyltransferase